MNLMMWVGEVITLMLLLGGAFNTGLALGEDNTKCKHERETR